MQSVDGVSLSVCLGLADEQRKTEETIETLFWAERIAPEEVSIK